MHLASGSAEQKFISENLNIHQKKSSNPLDFDPILLNAWFMIALDSTFRKCRRDDQLSRCEVILLMKIFILNKQNIPASKSRLLHGWRCDYKRAQVYLERLCLKGYINIQFSTARNFGRKKVIYYFANMTTLQIIRTFSNQMQDD